MLQTFFQHTTADLRSGRQSWRVRFLLGSSALAIAILNVGLQQLV